MNCVQSSCQVLMNSEGRLIIFKGIAFKTQADAELISRLEFIQSIHLYVLLKRVRVGKKSYVQYCGCSCSNTRIYVLEKKAWCFKVTFHDYIYGIFRSKNRKHAIYFLCLAKGQVHLAEKFSHALQQIEWLALCHL